MKKFKTDNEMLYYCESELTADEYAKMSIYFPKFYFTYVLYGTIYNFIVCFMFYLLMDKSLLNLGIIFFVIEIFILFIYRMKLKTITKKGFIRLQRKMNIDEHYTNEFYGNYLIRKNKSLTRNIEYNQIIKLVETDAHFYLQIPSGIIILQKNKCSDDLISFIKEKCANKRIEKKNSVNVRNEIKNVNLNNKERNMKILFVLTLLSIWGALWTTRLFASDNSLDPLLENMWVFWLWLPLPIISIIWGFKYKKVGIKCTKNIVAGFIVGFLLLMYGCFSFLFDTFYPKSRIISLVQTNEKLILRDIEKNNFDNSYKIDGIDKITFDKEYIEFFCESEGMGAQTSYYGFYYSSNGEENGLWFASTDELEFDGIGYYYKELNGDNKYYTEQIKENFYYYEGHF